MLGAVRAEQVGAVSQEFADRERVKQHAFWALEHGEAIKRILVLHFLFSSLRLRDTDHLKIFAEHLGHNLRNLRTIIELGDSEEFLEKVSKDSDAYHD